MDGWMTESQYERLNRHREIDKQINMGRDRNIDAADKDTFRGKRER